MAQLSEKSAALEPFTLEHFRAWASEIVLDDDEYWTLEPFQEAFVEDLFSGRHICWLIIPEGNGKTTLIAGLGLYYCEFKPYAVVLAAAAAVEQAALIYAQAEGMVLRTPRLHAMTESEVLKAKGKRTTERPLFECLEGWKRINHASGSRFQVRPADASTGDGVIPTLCLIDELHRHRNLALYRTWAGKLRKRGGQMIVISTAGEPGSEFEETREHMRQSGDEYLVRDCFTRSAGATWVLHDWAVPEGADLSDLSIVVRANPLSHVTVDTLAETWATPGMTLQHWSRLNCNMPTRASAAAIAEHEWFSAISTERIPEGALVWLGIDFGWRWDTTAIVPLWWRDSEFRLFGPATILEPPMDGSSLDPNLVKRAIRDLAAQYTITHAVIDINNANDIAAWMSDDLELAVVDRAQTVKPQVEDYQRFMEGLRQGWIKHSGDQVFKQHAMNAMVKVTDGGPRFARPSETRQGGNQALRVIDALVAAAMVHSYAAEKHGEPPPEILVAWA